MRINRCVRTLAAVAGVAAATAPAAYASDIGEGGGGLPFNQVTTTHRDSGSTDWGLIAVGAGGAIVLVGAGVGGSRAHRRRRTSAHEVEPARVS